MSDASSVLDSQQNSIDSASGSAQSVLPSQAIEQDPLIPPSESEGLLDAATALQPELSQAPPSNLPTPSVEPSRLSPALRRPKAPLKGILKPPPPPPKPTLGNRLRDIVASSVNVVGEGAKSLFDPAGDISNAAAGPSSRAGPSTTSPPSITTGVGGTFTAISGRLGFGLSRLVAVSPTSSGSSTPTGSPMPARSISLPETATSAPPIESTHRSLLTKTTGAEYWTSARLVTLYENACRLREERPRTGIIRALEKLLASSSRPRHLHLHLKPIDPLQPPHTAPNQLETPLKRHAAEALADLLTAEWGLSELKLENGVIEGEETLKPILHALLVSGTLPTLSLAGNKKVRSGGWHLLAVFLKRAQSLRFIDLSDTSWDKKGVEFFVQGLNCALFDSTALHEPSSPMNGHSVHTDRKHLSDTTLGMSSTSADDAELNGKQDDHYGSFILPAPLLRDLDGDNQAAAVQTLRMDGCGLKATVLETLAQGVRSSDVKNISLRRNRIGPLGAVALALMIRDYPDSALSVNPLSPSIVTNSTVYNSSPTIDRVPSPIPYVPRSRRQPLLPSLPPTAPSAPTTNARTDEFNRSASDTHKPPLPPLKHPLVMREGGNSAMQDGASSALSHTAAEGRLTVTEAGGASVALARSVRALDGVERIGRLLTLDLRSNEIKNGVGYIAQVLKRNRTLRVLNLSDNRIEAPGLAALAEALVSEPVEIKEEPDMLQKYNSSLETLDMSSNPCCGLAFDGVAALRTTFTVNTSLKRLFLSDTNLTTEGAIAVAEFLPETKALLHLDLTSNPSIDTAGILAISVGLKANTLIRCLDISIPPNDAELAGISQNILQVCIRNTELAAALIKEGRPEAIWAPIKKSALVRHAKEADDARAEKDRVEAAQSPQGVAREYVYTLKPDDVALVSHYTARDMHIWLEAGRLANGSHLHSKSP
ncbi:MAG: hypothetical protein TREMPRED_001605, partial [Tremellales sp. Tagirdzhanova-0007]